MVEEPKPRKRARPSTAHATAVAGDRPPTGQSSRPAKRQNNKSKKKSRLKLWVLFGIVCGLLVAAALIVVRQDAIQFYWRRHRLSQLSSFLQQLEREADAQTDKRRVSIGVGACLDIFVDAIELLKELEVKSTDKERHFEVMSTLEELENSFNFYFAQGAAAERYFSNSKVFQRVIVKATDFMSSTFVRRELGGNAPVMAKRFADSGWEVMLGANMHPSVQDKLPSSIQLVGSNTKHKDIHILMEYRTGDRWGNITAPRSNRFIIHNDQENPMFTPFEFLVRKMNGFKPNLLVLGGLQMMDNFPYKHGQMEIIFMRFEKFLSENVPRNTLIHLEFASFTNEYLITEIMMHVVKYSDSIGMNEQELDNIYHLLRANEVLHLADAFPTIEEALGQAKFVFETLLTTPELDGKRTISRLHVHTIGFQLVFTRLNKGWKSGRFAAVKSSMVAYRHTCQSETVDLDRTNALIESLLQLNLPENVTVSYAAAAGSRELFFTNPVLCWNEEATTPDNGSADHEAAAVVYEVCASVNLVCTDVKQTTGAGDNISSAALIVQL